MSNRGPQNVLKQLQRMLQQMQANSARMAGSGSSYGGQGGQGGQGGWGGSSSGPQSSAPDGQRKKSFEVPRAGPSVSIAQTPKCGLPPSMDLKL